MITPSQQSYVNTIINLSTNDIVVRVRFYIYIYITCDLFIYLLIYLFIFSFISMLTHQNSPIIYPCHVILFLHISFFSSLFGFYFRHSPQMLWGSPMASGFPQLSRGTIYAQKSEWINEWMNEWVKIGEKEIAGNDPRCFVTWVSHITPTTESPLANPYWFTHQREQANEIRNIYMYTYAYICVCPYRVALWL